jgi:hypothetical protein
MSGFSTPLMCHLLSCGQLFARRVAREERILIQPPKWSRGLQPTSDIQAIRMVGIKEGVTKAIPK